MTLCDTQSHMAKLFSPYALDSPRPRNQRRLARRCAAERSAPLLQQEQFLNFNTSPTRSPIFRAALPLCRILLKPWSFFTFPCLPFYKKKVRRRIPDTLPPAEKPPSKSKIDKSGTACCPRLADIRRRRPERPHDTATTASLPVSVHRSNPSMPMPRDWCGAPHRWKRAELRCFSTQCSAEQFSRPESFPSPTLLTP